MGMGKMCLVCPPASGVYGESSAIHVRDSDRLRDRVKVRVTSVVLVTARVRLRRYLTLQRCNRSILPVTIDNSLSGLD